MSLLTTDYQQLLRDLKGIVEGLLISQVANVWNVYGGLNRLHAVIENIFKHQLKVVNNESNLDCWQFIQGLNWLQPDITTSTLSVDSEYQPHLPTHLKTDKVSLWLYRSLENHTLSQKLSWLLSDKEHLTTCYHENAFMLQEKYTEATLICLQAVERNIPSLLSEIDPCLFINSAKEFHKSHRRCSSFPDAIQHRKWTVLLKKLSIENIRTDTVDRIVEKPERPPKKHNVYHGKLKPWRSMPNLTLETIKVRRRSSTFVKSYSTNPNSPVHKKLSPSLLQVNYSTLLDSHAEKPTKTSKTIKKRTRLNQSKSSGTLSSQHKQPSQSLPCKPNTTTDTTTSFFNIVRSAPDYTFSVLPGEKDYKKRPKKSFIEDGGSSILPMATGYFPKPIKGQTLTSFLSSSQFSRTNAELDRENAHFSISEAMIAAIEQIKWKRDLKVDEDQVDSDEEINYLKQRISLRRKQKQEKIRKMWEDSENTGSLISETSRFLFSSSPDSPTTSYSSEEVEDLDIDEAATLAEQKGLSMSMASLYSEADLLKRPRGAPDGASDILSAEGVALSLISKFNEKQLPRASDLEWLVSEQDAPQELLPLPKSWPISPDEYTPLRGTIEWAPPRPQIIFTIHPNPVRKILMAKQNYRCAGCGVKVAPQYASRFRYCDYLGRYFCTGCHTNQLALIPGKILQKWDFGRYPVSSFSYRLLEQMYNDPLFCVVELNRSLFKKSKSMEKSRTLRWQLFYLRDFILNCRYAEVEQEMLQKETNYMTADIELYSINDLVQIKNGEFVTKLRNLVETCAKHALKCQLCTARAFICEICNKDELIFPWQLNKIDRCEKCHSCYHIACWKSLGKHCSKCVRIEARLQKNIN